MRSRLVDGGGSTDGTVAFLNGFVHTFGSQPSVPSGWPADMNALSQGSGFICGVSASRGQLCGGSNNDVGQLGNGNMSTPGSSNPTVVYDPDSVLAGKNVIDIDSGASHTCALADDGAVGCWGRNAEMQLGNLSSTSSSKIVAITNYQGILPGAARKPTEIALGGNTSCISTSNAVLCWGANDYGQLGQNWVGGGDSVARPNAGSMFASGARSLSVTRINACAIAVSDGRTYCWGWNGQGQVGNGGTAQAVSTPTLVTITTTLFKGVAAGSFSTCGWTELSIECWGSNQYGGLGRGVVSGSWYGAGDGF